MTKEKNPIHPIDLRYSSDEEQQQHTTKKKNANSQDKDLRLQKITNYFHIEKKLGLI